MSEIKSKLERLGLTFLLILSIILTGLMMTGILNYFPWIFIAFTTLLLYTLLVERLKNIKKGIKKVD